MSDITRVVCNFSFGLGSWCASKRMVEEFGKDKVFLVFADVKWEDEDTYAWGRKAAEVLGCRLFEIEEGRTPWQTFEDSNYIGNSAVDPCSKILKRQLIDRWLSRFFKKSQTLRAFGIHWSEQHRFYRIDRETGKPAGIKTRLNKLGWKHVRAPLCEVPYIGVHDMEKMAEDAGLWKQKLYQLGFPHANCGGRCVKQGQKGWALLYKTMPERFIEVRDKEEALRERIGDHAMLKETINGKKFPLPLIELQKRLDAGKDCSEGGMGGCSCFAEDEE